MKKILMCLAVFVCGVQHFSTVSAESKDVLKAAFIRNDDLWIKIENKEQKVTEHEYARFPKWSFDGKWVAYMRGSKEGEFELYEGDLWLYNLDLNKHMKVASNVKRNFQWAPNRNALAFQSGKALKVIDIGSLNQLRDIASRIENFSWLPDGSSFLTSSKESEDIYSNIILSKVAFNKDTSQTKIHSFHTISIGKNDTPFVSTSQFTWSKDEKWIAFQLVPTASMSADSNTLFVLSNDGKSLKKMGEMLSYEDWFEWAPINDSLGYIEGSNRVSIKNKKLKVRNMFKDVMRAYTPKGYADRDLAWKSDNQVFVSRSMESEWADVEQRPMPSIYHISLQTRKQKEVTSPSANEGDFYPISINNGKRLIWIRTNREKADVLIANNNDFKPEKWIKKMEAGSWYYEYWNWDEVFSLYNP